MINWIEENLGTSSYNFARSNDELCIIDVRDMVDKVGNFESVILDKINSAVLAINQGNKVVICCDYGISRSNGIAIGVCSVLRNMDFFEATKYVVEKIGKKEIKPEIISAVYKALNPDKCNCEENNVLLTGGSGFIGSKLRPLLDKGNNVYAPARSELELSDSLALDIYVKKNKISYILHLANPRIYNGVSALGETVSILRNVLGVCEVNNVHLMYVSCWEVYSGYRAASLLASEHLPLFPKGLYGETKMICELLIKTVAKNNAFKHTIVRSSAVYGEGADKPKFLSNFSEKASKNREIFVHEYANGLPCLDLIYIDDLIDILAKVVNSKTTGEFNIGTGVLTSTTEIANLIKNHVKSESKIATRAVQSYWANIAMDITKTRNLFNWMPSIDVETGIKRCIDFANDMVRREVTYESNIRCRAEHNQA